MIQFNLLPDVKLEYLKAKRLKALMSAVSILIGSISLAVALVLVFTVNIVQTKSIKDLDEDISTAAETVQGTGNLNRILTVQNQLQSLESVHSTKPAVTRLFDYLSKTTPEDVTLSSTKLDLVGNTLVLTGQGTDLLSINRYVDLLKFTTFVEAIPGEAVDEAASPVAAFPQVVLSGFSPGTTATTFQLTVGYAPEIFDNQKIISLIVPKGITTRSQQNIENQTPTILFKEDPKLNNEASDE